MSKLTTFGGLIIHEGKYIGLPEADIVANQLGYVFAEQLVEALQGGAQYDYPTPEEQS